MAPANRHPARLTKSFEAPVDGDAWHDVLPEPRADADQLADPEWLWSRGIPDSLLEHEIRETSVRRVLDDYHWQIMPMHGDRQRADEAIWQEMKRPHSPIGPAVGNTHHSAVFTSDIVDDLRRWHGEGLIRAQDIANRYGCSRSSVSKMLRGKSWAHVVAL